MTGGHTNRWYKCNDHHSGDTPYPNDSQSSDTSSLVASALALCNLVTFYLYGTGNLQVPHPDTDLQIVTALNIKSKNIWSHTPLNHWHEGCNHDDQCCDQKCIPLRTHTMTIMLVVSHIVVHMLKPSPNFNLFYFDPKSLSIFNSISFRSVMKRNMSMHKNVSKGIVFMQNIVTTFK